MKTFILSLVLLYTSTQAQRSPLAKKFKDEGVVKDVKATHSKLYVTWAEGMLSQLFVTETGRDALKTKCHRIKSVLKKAKVDWDQVHTLLRDRAAGAIKGLEGSVAK